MKEKILVSACLLGAPCRYDGKSKPVDKVIELEKKYTLIPFCPEVEGGLSTPRLPCEIRDSKVIRSDGEDCTLPYTLGAEKALDLCKKYRFLVHNDIPPSEVEIKEGIIAVTRKSKSRYCN